jgi:hypothetical protein
MAGISRAEFDALLAHYNFVASLDNPGRTPVGLKVRRARLEGLRMLMWEH